MSIYFVRNTSDKRIKFGYSGNVPGRLPKLRTGCSGRMELLGSIPGELTDEKKLHALLKANFEHGNGEWYVGTDSLCRYIRNLVTQQFGMFSYLQKQNVFEPHLSYATSAAVGFLVSVYWMKAPRDKVSHYQIMRWTDGPGKGCSFWSWYLQEMPQWFDSPVKAASAFVTGWQDWRATRGDLS